MKGVFKYPCKECEFKGSQLAHLQLHIKSMHEGVKYPFDKCDNKTKQINGLQQ